MIYAPPSSNNTFYLSSQDVTTNSTLSVTTTTVLGVSGDLPLVGTWSTYSSGVGVFDPPTSVFTLRSSSPNQPDIQLTFGGSGDLPLIGRWINLCQASAPSGIGPLAVCQGYKLVVNSTGDDPTGNPVQGNPSNCLVTAPPNQCTLRDAITAAGPGQTISFDPSVYNHFINLTQEILVNDSGNSKDGIVIQGPTDPTQLPPIIRDVTPGIQAGRAFRIQGIHFTLNNLIIQQSSPVGNGGAIINRGSLTLNNVQLALNHANKDSLGNGSGGAIYNDHGATLIISNSRIGGGNQADVDGGGIANFGYVNPNGNPAAITGSTFNDNLATNGRGGALYSGRTGNSTNTALRIFADTFDNNVANQGGAIYLDQDTNTNPVIWNTTLTYNSANDKAGALYVANGQTTLYNSTFSYNGVQTQQSGGAIFFITNFTMANTIVANSQHSGVVLTPTPTPTVSPTPTTAPNAIDNCDSNPGLTISGPGNLQWPGMTCGVAITSNNPNLAQVLALNGVPSTSPKTLALQSPSAAIDHGDNPTCQNSYVGNFDERGHTRISTSDPTCDIGAYEFP